MSRGKGKTAAKRAAQRERSGRWVTMRITENAPGSYSTTINGSASLGQFFAKAVELGLDMIGGRPPSPPWQPLEPTGVHPGIAAKAKKGAEKEGMAWDGGDEHWVNFLYLVEVRHLESGFTHLSIRRNDKTRTREWRHLQQIKNEICGPESEAMEIFPAESRLVDQADQYHLWVAPAGQMIPVGYGVREVATPEEAEEWSRKHGVVVDQSPWVEGLTTGQPLEEEQARG